MCKYSLEDLGWKCSFDISDEGRLVYVRGDERIYIDVAKNKLCISQCSEISFATLEAIRELIISNAIY